MLIIFFLLIVLSRISTAFISPGGRQETYNGGAHLAGDHNARHGRDAVGHSDMEDSDCAVISGMVAIFCADGIMILNN